MAVLLDRPRPGRRGVVVLTHKEVKWLYRGGEPRLGRRARAALQKRLDALRSRYAFGVHVGSRLSERAAALDPHWEFVVATERLAPGLDERRRIPFVSARFIPDDYGLPLHEHRGWDLALIATNSPLKQWPRFLEVAAEMLAVDPTLRILGVATRTPASVSLRPLAEEILGEHLGHGLVLEEPTVDGFHKGWHPRVIERLLADTSVLCLFSRLEGTPKVVSEASLAGCLIVMYGHLLECCVEPPAGTDHIRSMGPGTEAATLLRAVRDAPNRSYDRDALVAHYGETASVTGLRNRLSDVLGQPVELSDTKDLRFRLPAHTDLGMPWVSRERGATTADAVGRATFGRLLDYLEALS